MSTIQERLQRFVQDISTDALEERVVEYILKEVQNGRRLTEVLNDPYVKNRLSEERLERVIENPEILETLEAQIKSSFEKKEFGFAD